MKRLTVQFEDGNAAFVDDPGEVGRILEHAAKRAASAFARGNLPAGGAMRDFNGNYCGTWTVEEVPNGQQQ